MKNLILILALCGLFISGCAKKDDAPTFTLAISEYPSWSAFQVAQDKGIIADVEKKYHVHIVLKLADYDTCMTLYGQGAVDAVCVTNMDVLSPALGRPGVAIMPTSTSHGADGCIVSPTIPDVQALKGKATYGLEKSVSQYAFVRNLQLKNLDPKDYPFSNMDPAAAAQAFCGTKTDNKVQSIMVWNPFVLQTLRTRPDAKVLFDSTSIPEEIIDCVVVGKDALAKPHGEDFATAVAAVYYKFNKLLADSNNDDLYVALGAKFSNLNAADMRTCCQQTQFYSTPDKALALFEGKTFQTVTMPRVVDFCVQYGIVTTKPTVGFEDPNAQVNFTTKYIKAASVTP